MSGEMPLSMNPAVPPAAIPMNAKTPFFAFIDVVFNSPAASVQLTVIGAPDVVVALLVVAAVGSDSS